MIKFPMHCFDVLFPINLGPLTYACPDHLTEIVQPGLIVQAPLRNKLTTGIVFDKNISPPKGPLKELHVIPGTPAVLSKSLLRLFRWMPDYYIAPEGLVLKQTMPSELFSKTRTRKSKKKLPCNNAIDFMDIGPDDLQAVTSSVNSSKYAGFLLHAPSGAM